MTRRVLLERLCRGGAVAIAVMACVDPQWTMTRSHPTRVAVVPTAGAADADVDRVRQTLASVFQVDAAVSPATAMRIVVGRTPPTSPDEGPTFVVRPDAPAAMPEIRSVTVADESPLNAAGRVAVSVAVPPTSASSSLTVSLSADGLPADTITRSVNATTSAVVTEMSFVPSRIGLARLRVSARLNDGLESHADVVTEVTERRLRVLFHDARPSWAGTFLRRTLEEDPRIEIVGRLMTSRGIGADAGAPPESLDRAEDLAAFDLVIVSMPELLTDRAAAALERYLRVREGAVVLLPGDDQGPVLSRLTGVSRWINERRPSLATITASSGDWSASEFLWPAALPPGRDAVTGCLTPGRCAVWRVPMGGGRVLVSSALDGWRTRAVTASGFAAFWRSLIGDEAAATPRPVEITLGSRTIAPGGVMSAHVETVGDAAGVRAMWQSPEGAEESVRLWRSTRGYAAEFRAPSVPGRYRLVVTHPTAAARAEFLVVEPAQQSAPVPDDDGRLAAFASSRGGKVIPMADVETLPSRLASAMPPTLATRPSHVMRSPWWMVPFAMLLAVEWSSRRRRGAR